MKYAAFVGLAVVAFGTTARAQAPSIPPAEQSAIVATALDYGDGFYSGAPERMERALHPDLNKAVVQRLPQSGRFLVGYSTYSGLIEMSRAKLGMLAPERRKLQATALSVNGDIALAKVTSAMFNDFLVMVKVDGAWKIVSVLWVPGPDTPNRPTLAPVDSAKDREALAGAIADFIGGIQASDAARLERVLHPEVAMAGFGAFPGAKPAINRTRYSGIIEAARAKLMPVVPEAARTAQTRIVDVMDGMAMAEVTMPNALWILQLARMDGEWKALNVVNRRGATPR